MKLPRLAVTTSRMGSPSIEVRDRDLSGRTTTHIPLATLPPRVLGTLCILGMLLVVPSWMARADEHATPHDSGGLIVQIGCEDIPSLAQLASDETAIICGLDTNPATVQKAREYLQSRGLNGRVSAALFNGHTLPFVDNLVTRLVAKQTDVRAEEILRVLHPFGIAHVGERVFTKPKPADTDEWTHYLHGPDNNAVAHDLRIGPPRHMQFLAAPLWGRHHDRLASLSSLVTAKGRMFYIVDNGPVFDPDESAQWTITARNAFNGVFLWRKPIASWSDYRRKFRSGPVQLQRLLVTDGDRVFVTLGLGEPVSILDAATGELSSVLEGTQDAEEIMLDHGMLFVQRGEGGAEQALLERRGVKLSDVQGNKRLCAVDVASGEIRWQWPVNEAAKIMPRTLALSEGRVFCQVDGETVCISAASGNQLWKTAFVKPVAKPAAKQKKKKGKRGKPPSGRAPGWTYATLVVDDGVVLSCDGNLLRALKADSGKPLWQCNAKTPFARTPSVDILVVRGVVWTSPGFGEGRDLHSGNIVSSNQLSTELVTAGHHHRCYRNKATDRYVIEGYRGLEFRDTQGDSHFRHNWIRGVCQYGIMPANGMVYMPPHNCGCYPEALLYGLWALKSSESTMDTSPLRLTTHVEKGPAYDRDLPTTAPNADNADWPMHRRDAKRSGVLPTNVSAESGAWDVPIAGRLSAATVANNTAVVAATDRHQVVALDATTGQRKWTYTTGGVVNSAPTIHGALALFGSADGYVYCVHLNDGSLRWRFRAAPQDRRTVSLQQVESLWPVPGSILIAHETAYFVAGRSSYIDGGLFLYGLDPASGEVRHSQRLFSQPAERLENRLEVPVDAFSQNKVDYKTRNGPDHSDAFSMSGNLSDILVADENSLYLRHRKLSLQLQPQETWTHHLFSTSSLLDDNESYRSHWFYGNGDFRRLPVAYEWMTRGSYGGFATPLGHFLVFDDNQLWGAGWKKLALYRTDITDIDQLLGKDFPKDDSKISHTMLAESLPIHPRAMIKTGEWLYLAGYPTDSTVMHISGEPLQDKGILLKVDADTGKILTRKDLPAPPRFDGMSAAQGRLYLALENGSLICLQ